MSSFKPVFFLKLSERESAVLWAAAHYYTSQRDRDEKIDWRAGYTGAWREQMKAATLTNNRMVTGEISDYLPEDTKLSHDEINAALEGLDAKKACRLLPPQKMPEGMTITDENGKEVPLPGPDPKSRVVDFPVIVFNWPRLG